MSGASFSTCSTSHLDLSDNNRELYGFHNFEESDSSVIIPCNKSSDKIENNHSASNLLLSSKNRNNHQKINLNEFDAGKHLLDGIIINNTHKNSNGTGEDDGGVGVESIKKYNDVKNVNSSNKNRIHYKKNNINIDDNNNDGNKNIKNNENNEINDNKCMMNVHNSKYDNEHVLTDLTANGIIIPVNITKNDDMINSIPNNGKIKIDGMIIGNYFNDIDNNDSNNNNNHYKNNKNNNIDINNDDNKDDDDDNDNDDGWKSMPSSNDFTATEIETMMNNDNNDDNDNITSNISKKKKIEKNRNKSTIKNETENKNENQNKNKVKNIHIDESTYDLYTDGTHSKILAYRFERVLLVETFKENAGN